MVRHPIPVVTLVLIKLNTLRDDAIRVGQIVAACGGGGWPSGCDTPGLALIYGVRSWLSAGRFFMTCCNSI